MPVFIIFRIYVYIRQKYKIRVFLSGAPTLFIRRAFMVGLNFDNLFVCVRVRSFKKNKTENCYINYIITQYNNVAAMTDPAMAIILAHNILSFVYRSLYCNTGSRFVIIVSHLEKKSSGSYIDT